jgi:hypothetical protein
LELPYQDQPRKSMSDGCIDGQQVKDIAPKVVAQKTKRN